MTEDPSKTIDDLKKRVEILENRLKSTVEIVNRINSGDFEIARFQITEYKESAERLALQTLLSKVAVANAYDKETTHRFLKAIMDCMPFPVFLKDEHLRYFIINKMEADVFGLPESQILGKTDADFVKSEEEMAIIRDSDLHVLRNMQSVELPNQKFSLQGGREYMFKTHKAPFVNPLTGMVNILGFSIDVTDSVNLKSLQDTFSKWNNPYL